MRVTSCTSSHPGYPDSGFLGSYAKIYEINEPQRHRGRREQRLSSLSRLTVTSCTSFNPGHPDSDLIIFCHLKPGKKPG